jgi:hypothetical protein
VLLVFGVAFALRVGLVLAYPLVHGGDAAARLAGSDRLLLSYQLPLPQLLVFVARGLNPDPLWTRLLLAVVGAAAAVALARALAAASDAPSGRIAGLLLAAHPLLVHYSTVPYQEGPMLLLLGLAAHALLRDRAGRAGLFLGLACLCRYEAWIAAALAAMAGWRRPARSLLLFGWGPLLWTAVWGGLSPAGTYVLDLDPGAGRLSRIAFLSSKLAEYSGGALLVLAAAGCLALWRKGRLVAWGLAFVGLVVGAVVVAGHEFPPGSGLVSERLLHLPAVLACGLAALALARLAGAGSVHTLARLRLAVVVAFLGWQGYAWARHAQALAVAAGEDPSLRLAFEVAKLADRRLGDGERLAVFGPPVPAQALAAFVEKVRLAGGDVERALALAASYAGHSPDRDRIAANLARPPRTVTDRVDGAALVAVFDDAPPGPERRPGPMVARFVAGARAASVFAPGP